MNDETRAVFVALRYSTAVTRRDATAMNALFTPAARVFEGHTNGCCAPPIWSARQWTTMTAGQSERTLVSRSAVTRSTDGAFLVSLVMNHGAQRWTHQLRITGAGDAMRIDHLSISPTIESA